MSSILDEEWFAEAVSGDANALGVDQGPDPVWYEARFESFSRCQLAALAPRMAKMLLKAHAARSKVTRDYDELDRLRDEICRIIGSDEIRKIVGDG